MGTRIIQFNVPHGCSVQRADKLFAAEFEDVSRVRLQRAFEAGQVTFEGQVIDKRFKIQSAGLLEAHLVEIEREGRPKAVEIPLDIIFEDAAMVVVNKLAGMVTHPGSGTGSDTLVHALLHHTNGGLSTVGEPDRPGIVHRLDKETTGLIVVAKTDLAHHRLAEAFSERATYKRYAALVCGAPTLESGSCREAIGRHPIHRTKMSVQEKGRSAHTDWQIKERFLDLAARVDCVIHTGRTHQIRVHMSHLGFPLLGDSTYDFKANHLPEILVPRVMLHANTLRLRHPVSEEALEFNAPLPDDFECLQKQLSAMNSEG